MVVVGHCQFIDKYLKIAIEFFFVQRFAAATSDSGPCLIRSNYATIVLGKINCETNDSRLFSKLTATLQKMVGSDKQPVVGSDTLRTSASLQIRKEQHPECRVPLLAD